MTYGSYPDLSKVKKVLVVKLRHLGDTLLAEPVFSLLKKRLQASVDAYIYKEAYPMLEGHPYVDDFIFCDPKKRSFMQDMRILRTIRKKKYDLVINLTEGDRGAAAALVSGAFLKVGFDPGKSGFLKKGKIYTHLVKNCPTPRHSVEKNLDALRKIGLFPKEDEKELFLAVEQEGNLPFDEYILVHPVSRWRFKCYPHMNKLAKELVLRGEKLVFSGGCADYELEIINQITKELPVGSYVNLAGKISLKELGFLIKQAKALITIDSVPLHMASALKTGGVAIFGPTSELNWGPWQNPKMRVVKVDLCCRPCCQDGCGGSKMADCLHVLSVNSVLENLFL